MAYQVEILPGTRRRPSTVANRLHLALRNTRFTCDVRLESSRVIRLDPVRLFEKKDYCGNHPGPCLVGGGRPHRHYPYLEGADWVAYNDLINTVLDRLGVVANVRSTVCVVRKGLRRRIRYDQYSVTVEGYGFTRQFVDWVRVGGPECYEDWCGRKAPPSDYPDGTPGYYGTTRAGQRRYAQGIPEALRRRGQGHRSLAG